ncbi:hypothetical protein NW759_016331 [Fusarium solani]|nr:hypothetical protein NW759_016331 [Fusarium solani]
MTISELSQKCEQAFEVVCADSGARVEAHDGKEAGGEKLLEALEREQGRFRIWARNIGALRDPTSTSSLDSRLHDAPKFRNAIASVLEGLLESLETVFGILKGDLPNRTAAIAVMDAGASQSNTTELKELALDVRSSITDLFRYSMFLRRQQPRGREAPTGAELRALDASLDVRHTTDMFPKLKDRPWLAERIGNAIAQRREYIRFRQRHQQPSAERLTHAPGCETASTKATTYKETDGSGVLPEEPQDASGPSIRTNATSFVTVFNNDGTGGLPILDLERLIFKNVQLKYGEYIECPFCRTIQKLHNTSEWSHFEKGHARDIAKSRVGPLLNMCDRPIQYFGHGSCPLCDTWNPEPNTGHNSQDFCKHLARHLRQLALSAIPLTIEGLEIKDDCQEEILDEELQDVLKRMLTRSELVERLNRSHDTFLSHLGSFIGRLHLQSQSRPELASAIKQSALSGGELLSVIDGVCDHSNFTDHSSFTSDALNQARAIMFERIRELVFAARDTLINTALEEADVIMPHDNSILLSSATGCVRAAGDCVAKAKAAVERIGDFEFEIENSSLGIDLTVLDMTPE